MKHKKDDLVDWVLTSSWKTRVKTKFGYNFLLKFLPLLLHNCPVRESHTDLENLKVFKLLTSL